MSEIRQLDEAILHCGEVATKGRDCAADHEQLRSWLMDLRRLRAIFPRILNALCNGSGCLPEASVEFMEGIPDEVRAEVQKWRYLASDPAQYTEKDPPGPGGPYAYNGGHCECH